MNDTVCEEGEEELDNARRNKALSALLISSALFTDRTYPTDRIFRTPSSFDIRHNLKREKTEEDIKALEKAKAKRERKLKKKGSV